MLAPSLFVDKIPSLAFQADRFSVLKLVLFLETGIDYSIEAGGFGLRYPDRKWLNTLIMNSDPELLMSLVYQAGREGWLGGREEKALWHAVENRKADPETLDRRLAELWQVDVSAVSRVLLGRSVYESFVRGAYELIGEEIQQNAELKTAVNRELKAYVSKELFLFLREELAVSPDLRQLCQTVLEKWPETAGNRRKEIATVLLNNPEISINQAVEKLGMSRAGLRKQRQKAEQEFLALAGDSEGLVELLCAKNQIKALKFIDSKPLLPKLLPLVFELINEGHLKSSGLESERLRELVQKRFGQGESYKKLADEFGVSEVTVNRFFEGRNPQLTNDPLVKHTIGAVEKFRNFLQSRLDREAAEFFQEPEFLNRQEWIERNRKDLSRKLDSLGKNPEDEGDAAKLLVKLFRFKDEAEKLSPRHAANRLRALKELWLKTFSDEPDRPPVWESIAQQAGIQPALFLLKQVPQQAGGWILRLFLSSRKTELRQGAVAELQRLAKNFPDLAAGTAQYDRLANILRINSFYGNVFGPEIYSELFPELGDGVLGQLERVRRINKIYLPAVGRIVYDLLRNDEKEFSFAMFLRRIIQQEAGGQPRNLENKIKKFINIARPNKEVIATTPVEIQEDAESEDETSGKKSFFKNLNKKKLPFDYLNKGVLSKKIDEQDLMEFVFSPLYQEERPEMLRDPAECLLQIIWHGCLNGYGSRFLPRPLHLSEEELLVLEGREEGILPMRLKAVQDSLFYKMGMDHPVYEKVLQTVEPLSVIRELFKFYLKVMPTNIRVTREIRGRGYKFIGRLGHEVKSGNVVEMLSDEEDGAEALITGEIFSRNRELGKPQRQEIGRVVARLREEKNLSITMLAREAVILPDVVRSMEKGNGELQNLESICLALGVETAMVVKQALANIKSEHLDRVKGAAISVKPAKLSRNIEKAI